LLAWGFVGKVMGSRGRRRSHWNGRWCWWLGLVERKKGD